VKVKLISEIKEFDSAAYPLKPNETVAKAKVDSARKMYLLES
jgi:hypothetical protein